MSPQNARMQFPPPDFNLTTCDLITSVIQCINSLPTKFCKNLFTFMLSMTFFYRAVLKWQLLLLLLQQMPGLLPWLLSATDGPDLMLALSIQHNHRWHGHNQPYPLQAYSLCFSFNTRPGHSGVTKLPRTVPCQDELPMEGAARPAR